MCLTSPCVGDACEQICFKLGMMLDMTRLYSLIEILMTLMFTQGHRGMGRLEPGLSLSDMGFFRQLADFRRLRGPTGHF